MKTAVLICLIICGTILVLFPALLDYLLALRATEVLMHRGDFSSFNFNYSGIEEFYRLLCWLLGGTMIGVAVLFAIPFYGRVPPHAPAAPAPV